MSRRLLLPATTRPNDLPCCVCFLCRLAELHAAGNNIASLPAQLAPYTSLTRLNLQHNQLQMAAVAAFGQLPVLQELDLGHNPLNGPAHCTQPVAQDNPSLAPLSRPNVFPQLQVLDLCSSRVKQLQPVQEVLGYMEVLSVLKLVHTPLAERCRSGKVQEQVGSAGLQHAGLCTVSDITSACNHLDVSSCCEGLRDRQPSG